MYDYKSQMKDLKETGLYLLISILIGSGLLAFVLFTPSEIGLQIIGICLAVCIFIVFCFILLLINGFLNLPLGKPVIKMYKK